MVSVHGISIFEDLKTSTVFYVICLEQMNFAVNLQIRLGFGVWVFIFFLLQKNFIYALSIMHDVF